MHLSETGIFVVKILLGVSLIGAALIGIVYTIFRYLWRRKFALLFSLLPRFLPDKNFLRKQILGNPLTRTVEARHPLAFLAFRSWLDPFTLVAPVLLFLLFLALVVAAFSLIGTYLITPALSEFDISLIEALASSRTWFISIIMIFATTLGQWYLLLLIGIVFTLRTWERKCREYILPFWATYGGTVIGVGLIKLIVGRTRPVAEFILEADGLSFPSAHAALAVAVGGFLIFYITKNTIKYGFKSLHILLLSLLILLIGTSRVYLGVHFPSDVLAGFVLGFLMLAFGIWFYEKLHRILKKPITTEPLLYN